MEVKRDVILADSRIWLKENKGHMIIITSLPDMDEVNLSLGEWIDWVGEISDALCDSLDDNGIIFFYQTDRKYKGSIIDKKTLISRSFIDNGFNEVMSKIVLRQKINTVALFRPAYTNLFAFSKKLKSGRPTPDVIDSGIMLYNDAMGFNAVKICIDYIRLQKIDNPVVDPFCGAGSVMKVANDNGFDAVGVDILEEMITKSENI